MEPYCARDGKGYPWLTFKDNLYYIHACYELPLCGCFLLTRNQGKPKVSGLGNITGNSITRYVHINWFYFHASFLELSSPAVYERTAANMGDQFNKSIECCL